MPDARTGTKSSSTGHLTWGWGALRALLPGRVSVSLLGHAYDRELITSACSLTTDPSLH